MTVRHTTESIQPGRVYRDGDFDATIYEVVVESPEVEMPIAHGLGRTPNQFTLVGGDPISKFPAISRYSNGAWKADDRQIVLIFAEVGIYRMRFC